MKGTTQINLFDETEQYLSSIRSGLTISDVDTIYFTDDADQVFIIDKQQFIRSAKETWFDPGYGCNEITLTVFLRGHYNSQCDFVMYRVEYDGAEGWSHIIIPKRCEKRKMDHLSELRSLRDNYDYYAQFSYDNIEPRGD